MNKIKLIKHNIDNCIDVINIMSKKLSNGQKSKYNVIKWTYCYSMAFYTPCIIIGSLLGTEIYEVEIKELLKSL